ncbi:MAG: serine protease inhibitor ecotin [Paludibacter sp.]|nr:serine protease inhibitor ecotin [Paludibacter sp.]
MKIRIFTVVLTMLFAANISFAQQSKTDHSMFPAASAGFTKQIITLPVAKNEDNLKVEIFVGKTIEVDCNRYFLSGTIKEQNLEGWGYTFYKVESNGAIGGTKMMCPDEKKTMKFVNMQTLLIRYNSKLPVVVYVPDGMELKYRIWKAGKLK